jgi:hypothetical protein
MRLLFAIPLFCGVAAAQLQITTTSVPVATQYQSYSPVYLTATGGTPPYTWSVPISGGVSLPEGMTLDPSTGVVSASEVYGQGGYAVTVQVTDSAKPTANTATATINFGVMSEGSFGGCQMFPVDSIYNQRVDALPVDTDSSHQIPSGLLGYKIHPDFGHGFYPLPGGIPVLRVPSNAPLTNVVLSSGGQIDQAGTYYWPIPPYPDAVIEETNYGVDGDDHHTLILQSSVPNVTGPQTGPCTLYETYQDTAVPTMFNASTNTWTEGAGVHYVLNSNALAASEADLDNGAQDSAGIPIAPLLISYAEVPLGVHHPLRISMPGPTNWFVWPATGCCNGSGPPQGLLYRLKASVNWQATCPPSVYPQAATVLQALQQYGAYMSDHGTAGFIQGVPDVRWDDLDLACMKDYTLSSLEVVDNSVLQVSDISGQTRPYIVTQALADATASVEYRAQLAAVGGNPANWQWAVSTGSLPAGLTLDSTTGVISGVPASSSAGTSVFNVVLTDTAAGNASQTQTLTLTVAVRPKHPVARR